MAFKSATFFDSILLVRLGQSEGTLARINLSFKDLGLTRSKVGGADPTLKVSGNNFRVTPATVLYTLEMAVIYRVYVIANDVIDK